MPSILRTSDFCRRRNPSKVPVKVEIASLPPSRTDDPWSSVAVSAEVLAAACFVIGSLAVLEYRNHKHVVKITKDSNLSDRSVRVSPTVAASLGLAWTIISRTVDVAVDDHKHSYESALMYAYDDASDHSIQSATLVRLRCLGNPMPSQRWSHTSAWTLPGSGSDCPFPSVSRLIQTSSISVVYAKETRKMYIYEILEIFPVLTNTTPRTLIAYKTTPKTQYQLEPPVFNSSYCRRLPPLSCVEQYQCHIIGRNNERVNLSTPPPPPPHPDSKRIEQALRIPLNSAPSERVISIVGTNQDHHVRVAVQVAADKVGMRCVTIQGLAAWAHAAGHLVTTGSLSDRLAGLNAAIDIAKCHAPCVLHLCDFDLEFSYDQEQREMEEDRVWSVLVDALTLTKKEKTTATLDVWRQTPSLLVVLSTGNPLSHRPGPLAKKVVYAPLLCSNPNEAYAQYLWESNSNSSSSEENTALLPYSKTKKVILGKSASDIVILKEQTFQKIVSTNSADEPFQIFKSLCHQWEEDRRKKASSLVRISNVKWEDIGGLSRVRREILDTIELPLKHPHFFVNGGRSGILLYGPPGTGKTMVAKAVATECGLPFLSIKGPELLGSFVGESEANVRAVFENAREAARKNNPQACILFFDELDSLAPRRGDSNSGGGVMDRVVATLAAQLDHQGDNLGFIFFMGATNRPDLLDPALLRPGRFDRLVYLGVASTAQERTKIIFAQIRKFKVAFEKKEDGKTDDPMDIAKLLVDHLPVNLTGADLSSIASGALARATQRLCNEVEEEFCRKQREGDVSSLGDLLSGYEENKLQPVVTFKDLINASKEVTPSVTIDELVKYERLRDQFTTSC